MKITPLKRYRTPEYPIQELLKAHPELLRFVPKRWANTPLMLSALSLVCMILAARDGSAADDKLSPSNIPAVASHVAPIFHHGSGRGSFGCVSTAAPVFLTEDEARQVITEEAAKAGIHFEKSKTAIRVERPVTDSGSGLSYDLRTRKPKTRKSSLVLDGTDAMRNLSFEFVSNKDYDEWETEVKVSVSSISSVNIEGAAEILQAGLTNAVKEGHVAVIYDPMYSGSYDKYGHNEQAARKKSLDALREQVRDFIAWLKAQGVI
jgi:hypothetical protein